MSGTILDSLNPYINPTKYVLLIPLFTDEKAGVQKG